MYRQQGRFEDSETLHEQTLEIRRRVLGEEHPETLQSMSGLAHVYLGQGRYGEAESLLLRAVDAKKRVLREGHPDTVESMSLLAELDSMRDNETE